MGFIHVFIVFSSPFPFPFENLSVFECSVLVCQLWAPSHFFLGYFQCWLQGPLSMVTSIAWLYLEWGSLGAFRTLCAQSPHSVCGIRGFLLASPFLLQSLPQQLCQHGSELAEPACPPPRPGGRLPGADLGGCSVPRHPRKQLPPLAQGFSGFPVWKTYPQNHKMGLF